MFYTFFVQGYNAYLVLDKSISKVVCVVPH